MKTQQQKSTVNELTITPLKLVYKCLRDNVTIYLKDNTILRGNLLIADPNMNLILEDAEELDNNNNVKIKYGKIFIRGNNILYIVAPPHIVY